MKLIKLRATHYYRPPEEMTGNRFDPEWWGNFVVGRAGAGTAYYISKDGMLFVEMPSGFVEDWEAAHKDEPEKLPHGPGIGFTVDAGSEALRLIIQHRVDHKQNDEISAALAEAKRKTDVVGRIYGKQKSKTYKGPCTIILGDGEEWEVKEKEEKVFTLTQIKRAMGGIHVTSNFNHIIKKLCGKS